MAVAAMKGFQAILRDAETAYLQALIDTPTRTPSFVELPREWWPDSWFHDGSARMRPKYVRPHCHLLRAVYGHPDAGAFWEATLTAIMQQQGWTTVPGSGSVFLHQPSHAICVVYVDDMLLLARPKDAGKLWRALESKVHFKDPEQPLTRYLGARYRFDEFNANKPNAVRKVMTDIDEYAINAVNKFKQEYARTLHKVSSPYITNE